MLKKLILSIALVALVVAGNSCNSKSSDTEYQYASSVLVSGFYIQDDSKVLDSLSNVFFTIDLKNAQIYNADSLPYGTKVSRLIPKVTVPSTAAAVTLTFLKENGTDSVSNYLTHPTDSIDFSKGPVRLDVTSQSGLVKLTYEIRVNVHQVKPDTLAWHKIEASLVPTSLSAIKAQRTEISHDVAYCLTTDGNKYSLATTADPSQPAWTIKEPAFSFTPNVESMRGTDDALYILDTDGNLYKSTDGLAWSATGKTCHYLYCVYGDQLLASVKEGDAYRIISYPNGKSWPMPEGFPVEGTTQTCTYDTEMATTPQLAMACGIDAEGNFLTSAWGFDGNDWMRLTAPKKEIGWGLADAAMVSYGMFETPNTTWRPQEYPVLVLFGGRFESGYINGTVYVSRDWGMSWQTAPSLMQLPAEVPKGYGTSAFVYATTESISRASEGWTSIHVPALPPQCQWVMPAPSSRVVEPITSWESPSIYAIGGHNYDGSPITTVWRGQILRYSFPPVY